MTEVDLGSALRTARRTRDVSQRELADLAEVPVSTVARIESGAITDPKFRTVERLLAAAGLRLLPTVADGLDAADANASQPAADWNGTTGEADKAGDGRGQPHEADDGRSQTGEAGDGREWPDEVGDGRSRTGEAGDGRSRTGEAGDGRDWPDNGSTAGWPVPHESIRDRAGKHFPAHLDVFDAFPWFDRRGDMLPAGTRVQTFHRNRGLRNDQRDREAPGGRVTIEFHEAESGHAWSWLAEADGHVVGRLTAQVWPPATSPPEPPRLVVLSCLVMHPEWRGKGVERRLIARLRKLATQKLNDWTVVTLAYPGLPWGYVGSYGFHPAVRGIQLLRLSD